MKGLRVKLVTGDVRHLEDYATSAPFFAEIEAASRLGHTVFWTMTSEGTKVNAMQVVEVGEPSRSPVPGRYVAKVWDNTARPGEPLYNVWDSHLDRWERTGGMEKHDAENIAWSLNGETA